MAITLILHNIRSTYNVGAIFRSAEGFGVKKIICSGYTPYPSLDSSLHDNRLPHIADKLTRQIHKSALGAETMVPFEHYELLDAWLDDNQNCAQRLPLYALEQAPTSIDLGSFQPADDFALLLGEEVHGIEQRYIDRCDETIEIAMYGQKESFNVSVAAGIALFGLTQ